MEDQLVIKADSIDNIKCSNCEKLLLILQKHIKSDEVICKLTVDCPFCNDKSFEKEIFGTLRYVPANGVRIKSVINDDVNKKIRFLTCK